ncbi:TPA: hypothetical protein ACXEV6_003511 [Serratia marcescens]
MTLTTERLKQLADPSMICKCSWDEYKSMATELLAKREAQPVGFRYRHSDTVSWLYNDWRWPDSVEADQCQIEWLYTAPPAPAVPEAIITAPIEAMRCGPAASYVLGWNACSAAMLQPVSSGYKLVPAEATEDMIAAAMNCDDVSFNADETFCVNFGNIYAAMLAAAPEGGNG